MSGAGAALDGRRDPFEVVSNGAESIRAHA
jgi:hypothetical protein